MGRRRLVSALVLCLMSAALIAHGQSRPSVSATVQPNLLVPLGDSSGYYHLGLGGSLLGQYDLGPLLGIRASFDYSLVPTLGNTNLSLFALTLGPSLQFTLPFKLKASAFVAGGWYLGLHEGQSGNNPVLKGGAGIDFDLSPSFGIGLGAQYNHFFTASTALLSSLSVQLGASYHFGRGARPPGVRIQTVDIPPLFPVFYKYYDDHPLGYVTVVNQDQEEVRDVTVSFKLSRYMAQAKAGARIERLAPREEKKIPLYALLTDDILEISEATKLTAQILVSFTQQEAQQSTEQATSVRLNDRNAMTWDDDQKAAAFISAKDPEVLRISKMVAGMAGSEGNDSLPTELKVAIGLWEAMRAYGIKYVPDPKTPYVEFSKNATQVDFLQFPVQTLLYKAGDCDDLSILYSALLESVGVETAFLTIPGHIYMAFSPAITPRDAEKLLLNGQTYFVVDEKVWIPVEITALQKGFWDASQLGFTQWKRYEQLGQLGFHPIRQAWQTYEPVGFVAASGKVASLDPAAIEGVYRDSYAKLRSLLLDPKLAPLKQQLSSDPNNPLLRARLGVLYARFGLFSDAEIELVRALQVKEDVSTLVNLGNLHFVTGNFAKAQEFYARAGQKEPENTLVLLALVRVNNSLGRFDESERLFVTIERLDSTMAKEYSYLRSQAPGTERAGSQAVEEKVRWVDD